MKRRTICCFIKFEVMFITSHTRRVQHSTLPVTLLAKEENPVGKPGSELQIYTERFAGNRRVCAFAIVIINYVIYELKSIESRGWIRNYVGLVHFAHINTLLTFIFYNLSRILYFQVCFPISIKALIKRTNVPADLFTFTLQIQF